MRVLFLIVLAGLIAGPAHARVLLRQKEALEIAFPAGTEVEKRTAFLDKTQVGAASALGDVVVDSRVWTYYVGKSSGRVTGYAYFETHTVKTMPETIMAVLEPEGSMRFVEILAFAEPSEYMARPNWLAQLKGKSPGETLRPRRGIKNIAGASLTARALADATRRILAVHRTIHGGAAAGRDR